MLLTSREALKILCRARDIGVDGTFKITPKPWKQVFIVSAEVREGNNFNVYLIFEVNQIKLEYFDIFRCLGCSCIWVFTGQEI